jgi:2-iminobutanoate/2-iminopropanoate deaminase
MSNSQRDTDSATRTFTQTSRHRSSSILTTLFAQVCLTALMCLATVFGVAQQPPTMSAVNVAKLPFSPGLQLGDTLYISGHLGVDPAVGKAPADPEVEARQVLQSVQKTLRESGFTMDDIVYVEIYCTDLKLYGTFNKAYGAFFKSPFPARDFIGVKDLLFGAHFEVMGIAVRNASLNKKQPPTTR